MTVNPRHSFKLKLCAWIFAVAALTFTAVFFVCIHYVKIEVKNDLDALVNSKLSYALRTVSERMTQTETSANNFASMLESPYIVHSQDSIFALCEKFLLVNPKLLGVAIGYEPDSLKGDTLGYAPYLMRSSRGFIRRDVAKSRKYRDFDWYKVAFESGKSHWSKPFIEANGTSIILAYSTPIVSKKRKIKGVMTVDLNLDKLNDSIQMLAPTPHSMVTILDKNGTFISHPNHDYIMRENINSIVKKIGQKPNAKIEQDFLARRRGTEVFKTPEETFYIYYAPIDGSDWTINMIVPRHEIAQSYDSMFKGLVIDIFVGIVLLLLVCVIVIDRLTKPLTKFAEAAREISHGDFHVELPVIKDHNELYDLRQSMASMQISLDDYIKELEKTMKSKATIEGELNIARNIQQAMIPKVFPPYPEKKELDIYATLTPAKAVGGDLYDFVLDGDDFYFCIGDVSGKGVPASLVMAITRSLFRNNAVLYSTPAKIAQSINHGIADHNDQNMFVTMIIAKFNLKTGVFSICNCGHNVPASNGLLDDPATGHVIPGEKVHYMETMPTNLPIGVIDGFEYKDITLNIEKGVSILLYTDGVTEAENPEKQLYGDDRLLNLLSQNTLDTSAEEIVKKVDADVQRHAAGAEQSDDITILCLRY